MMARKVAGAALRIYDDAKEIPVGTVKGYREITLIARNPHEEWEVPIAQQIVACKVKKESELPDELRAHHMSLKKAARILANVKNPEPIPVTVHGLQIGNFCVIGIPGEPFSETGMDIKAQSKMDMTFVTCRTNGSEGYFPTRRAFDGTGYERDYTRMGPDCAQNLVDAAKAITDRMEKA
jgi:hypothetical protein